MYEMTIEFRRGETATITLPSVDCVHAIAHRMNENIWVAGEQISARDGKHPDHPNSYFAGVTRDRLKMLYGEL